MAKKPLVVVGGVTASGKTRLGIALCRRYGGEVLSADSMQIYRDMDIATAAPTREEREQAVHHLVGFLSPEEEFTVADWAARARGIINGLHGQGKLPVAVGGTGLYLTALMDNVRFESFGGDPAVRAALEEQARAAGPQALYERLRRADPVTAEKVHPNNVVRVIRALEVCDATGVPMAEQQRRAVSAGPCYDICAIALGYRDRRAMRAAIDARVDRMLAAGLVEEARAFYRRYPSRTAGAAIGFKELLPYFKGEATFAQAVELLKTRTRQYAKRQMTWLRRDPRFVWIYVDDFSSGGDVAREAIAVVDGSGLVNP